MKSVRHQFPGFQGPSLILKKEIDSLMPAATSAREREVRCRRGTPACDATDALARLARAAAADDKIREGLLARITFAAAAGWLDPTALAGWWAAQAKTPTPPAPTKRTAGGWSGARERNGGRPLSSEPGPCAHATARYDPVSGCIGLQGARANDYRAALDC